MSTARCKCKPLEEHAVILYLKEGWPQVYHGQWAHTRKQDSKDEDQYEQSMAKTEPEIFQIMELLASHYKITMFTRFKEIKDNLKVFVDSISL